MSSSCVIWQPCWSPQHEIEQQLSRWKAAEKGDRRLSVEHVSGALFLLIAGLAAAGAALAAESVVADYGKPRIPC